MLFSYPIYPPYSYQHIPKFELKYLISLISSFPMQLHTLTLNFLFHCFCQISCLPCFFSDVGASVVNYCWSSYTPFLGLLSFLVYLVRIRKKFLYMLGGLVSSTAIWVIFSKLAPGDLRILTKHIGFYM